SRRRRSRRRLPGRLALARRRFRRRRLRHEPLRGEQPARHQQGEEQGEAPPHDGSGYHPPLTPSLDGELARRARPRRDILRLARRGVAMQIRQFRVVLKAKNFDRTCNFYGEVLALPRLQSWDDEEGRGALYQAGSGAVQVIGRPRDSHGWDEDFDYAGPQHKLVLAWIVPSAERAYEELLFRDKN